MRLPGSTPPMWKRPANGRRQTTLLIAVVLIIGATAGAVLAETIGIEYALTAIVLLGWPAAVFYTMRSRNSRPTPVAHPRHAASSAAAHPRPAPRSAPHAAARHTPILRRVK